MIEVAQPSPLYGEAVRKSAEHHAENKTFSGRRVLHSWESLYALCQHYQPKTLLDYGCGKGVQWDYRDLVLPTASLPSLAGSLGVTPTLYDPCVPAYATKPPRGAMFDAAIVIDVLEYVPAADLSWVLDEIFAYASQFVLISAYCQRPTKNCVVEEDWNRPLYSWCERFIKAASANRHVTWFARMHTDQEAGKRVLICGRGGCVHFAGRGQFTPQAITSAIAELPNAQVGVVGS